MADQVFGLALFAQAAQRGLEIQIFMARAALQFNTALWGAWMNQPKAAVDEDERPSVAARYPEYGES
jgi:hypothetical protein